MEERDFKGIWIPKEIWLDKNLTALDKIILMEIDSLDTENGCFASNEYLSNFCQCSERKITESISKLIDLQYITKKSFDGRNRILESNLTYSRQSSKNCEAETNKMQHNNINNNIEDNKENIIINNNIKENEILEHWNSQKIIKHKMSDKILKAIKKALKEYSIDDIKLSISHYAEVFKSAYYFDYKWDLESFLKQDNCLEHFLDDGTKWQNYLMWKNKQNVIGNSFSSNKVIKKPLSEFAENYFNKAEQEFMEDDS